MDLNKKMKEFGEILFGKPRELPNWTFRDSGGDVHSFKKRSLRMLFLRRRKFWLIPLLLISGQANAINRDGYPGQRVEVTNWSDQNLPKTSFGELIVAEPHAEVVMMFPYGFNSRISTINYSASGSSRSLDGLQFINTGTTAGGKSAFFSIDRAHYLPGQGQVFRGTALFTSGVDSSTQAIGMFTKNMKDGYGFGYDGANFGMFRIDKSTTSWFHTENWNVDKMDGTGPSRMTLDPTKGNVYQISMQWLGFGAIMYEIEDDDTGEFQTVHVINYANANTRPSSFNPSLPIAYQVESFSSTTDLELGMASAAIYHDGTQDFLKTKFSTFTLKSVGTTEIPMISVRSTGTFKNIESRISQLLTHLTIINQSATNSIKVRIYLNSNLVGSAFRQANDNVDSATDIDEEATSFSGGEFQFIFALPPAESFNEHIVPLDVSFQPGQSITITGQFFSGSGNIFTGITWEEKY